MTARGHLTSAPSTTRERSSLTHGNTGSIVVRLMEHRPLVEEGDDVLGKTIDHLQFMVRPANLPFYRDLMSFLEWEVLYDGDAPPANEPMLGVAGVGGTSVWFTGNATDAINDYDGPGLNHFAFGAASQTDVDAAATYLTERGVELLFETPRHRPEFARGDTETYYQMMFESPDRILLEIVYTGPKSI